MKLKLLFTIVFLLCNTHLYAANTAHVSINPKIGTESWDNIQFVLNGNIVEFANNEETFGLSAEYNFDFGLSVGGELLFSRIDIKRDDGGTNSVDPYANSYSMIVQARYYFLNDTHFQPFLGIGIGQRRISTHSDTIITLSGPEASANVGLKFPIGNLSGTHGAVTVEYKRKYFDIDEAIGSRINTRTDVFLVGGSINF